MMKKHVTACLTAAAVLAAPVAVSGTLTAGAIAQEASAPAPAADQKPDVLGRPTVSEKQVSDEEGYFDSAHGEGVKIYYRKQKVANPRGAVVLAHGVSEHSGRYDYVAKRLLDAGYNVYRVDHRGHGKSAGGSVPRGTSITSSTSWMTLTMWWTWPRRKTRELRPSCWATRWVR